jgi:hypothetical protein
MTCGVTTIEPGTLLVVAAHDVPRSEWGIGGGEHVVAGAGIVIPPAVRVEIHRRELPDLARVVDPRLEAASLLLLAHLEPVLEAAG